jgi:hypothetical protein
VLISPARADEAVSVANNSNVILRLIFYKLINITANPINPPAYHQ